MKKTVRDIGVKGKRVLVRCDFNVPMNGSYITDDVRIKAALPTIEYLMKNGAKVILMSHMGRPEGRAKMEYTLAPVAERLSILIDKKVTFISCPEVISERVRDAALKLGEGDVMLLENTRFRKEETKNLDTFSKELSELGDVFVNDAFGTARGHASNTGVAAHLVSVAGFLMEKEVEMLGMAIENPEHPYVVILGGAKVSDKIGVITNLLEKADRILIGGAMMFTFLKALGRNVGDSLVEDDKIELAREILDKASRKKVDFVLPVDAVTAREIAAGAEKKVVMTDEGIPTGWKGLDIGPKTVELFKSKLADAKTVVWNGPMGVFEMPWRRSRRPAAPRSSAAATPSAP